MTNELSILPHQQSAPECLQRELLTWRELSKAEKSSSPSIVSVAREKKNPRNMCLFCSKLQKTGLDDVKTEYIARQAIDLGDDLP